MMNFRDFFSFQKRIYFKLVGFILFVAFLSSCQDCTFESDNITFARLQFHHRATKDAFDKEALDSAFISVRAINDLTNIDQVFEGRATINPNDAETVQTLTYNLPLYTSDIRSTFLFAHDSAVLRWAEAANIVGRQVLAKGGDFRHGRTWFVGVDVMPNAPDGSIEGVPLEGAWQGYVDAPDEWHAAQLSVVFPGYPKQDSNESDAAHRFRRNRDAAHVDGLLPEGPDKRRHLREPHGFILGLPLDQVKASPLVVWRGSHKLMRDAFGKAFAGAHPSDWGDLDVTDMYQATRRQVFETCERVEVVASPGQAILLDRHILHGVAPWAKDALGQMRMMAYFRPQIAPADWL